MAGTKNLTVGRPLQLILGFAFPLLFGFVFQQLYNVVDSLVVGNVLGTEALAAVSSSGSLIFLLIGFFSGAFTGAGVVISRAWGARDHEKVSRAVHTMLAFGLSSGLLLTVVGLILTPVILRLMGTPEAVLPNSILYFRIYFSGVMTVVLFNVCSGIFQAVGDSRRPLLFLVVSSCTNVVLDLLFVAVLDMGIGGAALATVLSQGVSAALGLWSLSHAQESYRIRLHRIRFHMAELKELLHMGIPSGMQNSIISLANLVVQSHVNSFGANAMAGCGAYSKIEGFGFLPVTSFCMAITTFVGQNLGAGQYDRAKKGAKFGIASCVVLAECIGVLIYWQAPNLVALFENSP